MLVLMQRPRNSFRLGVSRAGTTAAEEEQTEALAGRQLSGAAGERVHLSTSPSDRPI